MSNDYYRRYPIDQADDEHLVELMEATRELRAAEARLLAAKSDGDRDAVAFFKIDLLRARARHRELVATSGITITGVGTNVGVGTPEPTPVPKARKGKK